MSLDLSFWKYEEGISYEPYDVYVSLSDGKTVTGVAILPIEEIRGKIDKVFDGWEKLDDSHLACDDEIIEIYTTEQFVRFDCYGVSENNMNKLIDIMLEFDCRLYDSAIDVRFD